MRGSKVVRVSGYHSILLAGLVLVWGVHGGRWDAGDGSEQTRHAQKHASARVRWLLACRGRSEELPLGTARAGCSRSRFSPMKPAADSETRAHLACIFSGNGSKSDTTGQKMWSQLGPRFSIAVGTYYQPCATSALSSNLESAMRNSLVSVNLHLAFISVSLLSYRLHPYPVDTPTLNYNVHQPRSLVFVPARDYSAKNRVVQNHLPRDPQQQTGDPCVNFYTMYKREATECDASYVKKYDEDINATGLIFVRHSPLPLVKYLTYSTRQVRSPPSAPYLSSTSI